MTGMASLLTYIYIMTFRVFKLVESLYTYTNNELISPSFCLGCKQTGQAHSVSESELLELVLEDDVFYD